MTTDSISAGDLNGPPPQRQRTDLGPSRGFAVVLVVLLAALAYVNSLSHPFVYDDLPLVLKNPEIRSLSSIPALVGFHDGSFDQRARWTRDVAYALEFALVGPWPPLYRLTNVALHALNGLLLMAFLRRATGNRLVALGAAVLFTVHPIGTDVVTQISGRRELLATCFALGTALLLQAGAGRHGGWRLAGAVTCLYLGIFSKEMAVMAPLVFVVTDLLGALRDPAGRSATGNGRSRFPWARLREHLGRRRLLYGVALGSMAALTFVRLELAEGGADRAGSRSYYDSTGHPLGPLDRARLAGLGLRLLLLPVGQSVDYSFDALGLVEQDLSPIGAVDLTVLLAAVVATAFGLYRRSWAGAGGALFFLLYLPTSGVIPWHEIFAERFLYLPSIGFHLAVASAFAATPATPRYRRALLAASLALPAVLGTATVVRNRAWASSERLWLAAVERYPECARAHKALADQYLLDRRPGDALAHYREAARILPEFVDARVGIGSALVELGRIEDGLREFEAVLAMHPEHAKALNDIGMVVESTDDLAAAAEYFERSARADPRLAEPYNNLGRIRAMRGDLPGAIRLYEEALDRDPSLLPALRNLATLYRYGLHDEEAAARYDEQAKQLLAVR